MNRLCTYSHYSAGNPLNTLRTGRSFFSQNGVTRSDHVEGVTRAKGGRAGKNCTVAECRNGPEEGADRLASYWIDWELAMRRKASPSLAVIVPF
jgi:hypothetical protein